jgi:uncharacterized protein (DUF1810 family)
MNTGHRHDLQRFVDAQLEIFDQVLIELRLGRKQSHWMWFIFPQIKGLGSSAMAQHYALSSLDDPVRACREPPRSLRGCAEKIFSLRV